MFDKQWIFQIEKHNEYIKYCKDNGKTPSFADEIMYTRGIASLSGALENLSDPYLLPDMAAAVDRILTAVEEGEKITVFGDYDADGVSATAVLYHFLQSIAETDVISYIPDRLSEGYGMSAEAITFLAKEGVTLIVTVDNGIVAFEQIDYAASLGIDVIVTDHHKCADALPKCCAVVNPCILKEQTPLSELCGAGVAFTLIRAIADEIGVSEEIKKYIPIVMIGTLGDVVPLKGDNRIIVKYGIEHLNDFGWAGLEGLTAKIVEGKSTTQKITATFISYQIVPKINAAGRLGNAKRAFELLVCTEKTQAEELINELIEENIKRQKAEAEIVEKAMSGDNLKTTEKDYVVVAVGEDWHHGVIGIVAARLTEKYKKPSFVLSAEKTEGAAETARGSARSVKGFNLHKALSECDFLLERFGGHEMAAGLSIKTENIQAFIEAINAYAQKNIQFNEPENLQADAVINAEQLTLEAVEQLDELEPYGQGNTPPLVCVRNLRIVNCLKVGDSGKHLKISFKGETKTGQNIFLDGIAFSQGAYENMLKSMSDLSCSVLCRPEVNNWQGQKRISMIISDIHDGDYNIDNPLKCVYNNRYVTSGGFVPNRKKLAGLYKAIMKYKDSFKFNDLYSIKKHLQQAGEPLTWYEIRNGLDIFIELDLVEREDRQIFKIKNISEKVKLENSQTFKMIQAEG